MSSTEELHRWLVRQTYNAWCNYVVRAEANIETVPAPAAIGHLGPQFRAAWNETWSERASSPYVRGAQDGMCTERLFTGGST